MTPSIPARWRILTLAVAAVVLAGPVWCKAPDWLAAAARAPVSVATGEAKAVVLLDEASVEYAPTGERTFRVRRVVKLIGSEGDRHAVARVPYLLGASTVKSLRAWLVRGTGKTKAYSRSDIVDLAVHSSALELYGEARLQVIDGSREASKGDIFGYEAVVVGRPLLLQENWHFGEALPVEVSRFMLKVPESWRVTEQRFHDERIVTHAAAGLRTWTMNALAAEKAELLSSPPRSRAAWLAVNLHPPAGPARATAVPIESWAELARYFVPKYDAAATVDASMKIKVRELTAGATTPGEKTARLARFVQGGNYVSLVLDSANLGGLMPRAAPRVFQCNYGDCKDKATLLRALLAEVGVAAYPLVVTSGRRQHIETSWPSPAQFNHCILAIAVSEPSSPWLIEHPELGRLLIFDPTDPDTPLGELRRNHLAGHALLLAAGAGGLVELPPATPASELLVRSIEAEVDARGNLRGRLVDRYIGEAASWARGEQRAHSRQEYQRQMERWLTSTMPAARTTKIVAADNPENPSEFVTEIEFASPGHGKMMRDELLVLKPMLVSRRGLPRFAENVRTLPVAFDPKRYEERAVFTLPGDCEVEEMAPEITVEEEFGRYRSTLRVEGGKLVVERTLELVSREVPVADYVRVKAFFDRVNRAEQSPVVLRRRLE